MSVTVKKSAKQLQIQVSALNSVSWLIVLGCFGCQVVTLKSKDAKNEIRIPSNSIAFTCSSPKDTGTSVTDGGLQHVIILARQMLFFLTQFFHGFYSDVFSSEFLLNDTFFF